MPTNSSATSVNDRPDERDPGLLDHHRKFLTDRAVSPTVATARGYSSTTAGDWLRGEGFSLADAKCVPALVIPWWTTEGTRAHLSIRPDVPPTKNGKLAKYLFPKGAGNRVDVPPGQRGRDHNALGVPLHITESPIKADAIRSAGGLVVAVNGVWGWRGKNQFGNTTALGDLERLVVAGREVRLVPDSDVQRNAAVATAVRRLGELLKARDADVRVCYLPDTANGHKQGVDDWLARVGDLEGLAELASDWLPYASKRTTPSTGPDIPFKGADDRFTDARMAETVAREVLADRYCWVASLGWLAWDGCRWTPCSDVAAGEAVRAWTLERFGATVADMAAGKGDADALDGWRKMLEAGKERAVLGLARGIVEQRLDALDAHPDLLNTPEGVVDLRTGVVRVHDPALLLTKATRASYRPGHDHQDWTQALEAVPEDARPWIQLRLGQAGTGYPPPDDRLIICQGSGENGKTTVMATIGRALGDHYTKVSDRLLLANPDHHPTELMDLRGARLAVAEETPEARRLSVVRLKRAVGDPTITARRIRRDAETFTASHTLLVNTNYRPVIEETDHGTWRRLALLRWPYTFRKSGEALRGPEDRRGDEGLRDRCLTDQEVLDAALTWLVEGARRWYTAGKVMGELPGRVVADTRTWREESDQVLAYVSERLVFDLASHVMGTDLLGDLNEWLTARGHRGWSDKTLAARFGDHDEVARHRVEHGRMRRSDGGLSRPTGKAAPWDGNWAGGDGGVPQQFRAWKGVRFRTDGDEPDDDPALVTGVTAVPVNQLVPLREGFQDLPSHPSQQSNQEAGGGGEGAAPPFDWQFADKPIGPCAECGGDCHTPGPDGQPIHPLCFNPAGGRSWQGTAAWKADGRPGLAGPSGGNE